MFKLKENKLVYVNQNNEEVELLEVTEDNWDNDWTLKDNVLNLIDNGELDYNFIPGAIVNERIQESNIGCIYFATFEIDVEFNGVIVDTFESEHEIKHFAATRSPKDWEKEKALDRWEYDCEVDFYEFLF